jgi:hypothetical protein
MRMRTVEFDLRLPRSGNRASYVWMAEISRRASNGLEGNLGACPIANQCLTHRICMGLQLSGGTGYYSH